MPSFSFDAIGTRWRIDVPEELSVERQAALLGCVQEEIERFDRAYSRFRDDSLVTAMSRAAGTYRLPANVRPMFELYERLYRLTDGAFTPLIGQTLVDAGYDASYSLVPKPLRAPPAWEEVIARDGDTLTLSRPALLDFGAGGKGYLADLVGEALAREGVGAFCVDAGGDVVYRGVSPLRAGLEDPRDPSRAIGVATIAGGSVCGSAGNRRAWAGYHHTIDPRTLASPTHVLATWAMAKSGLVADALATALYFADPETLAAVYTFDYVILHADGTATRSPDAPVELFS